MASSRVGGVVANDLIHDVESHNIGRFDHWSALVRDDPCCIRVRDDLDERVTTQGFRYQGVTIPATLRSRSWRSLLHSHSR
jgi:hypothetical protein